MWGARNGAPHFYLQDKSMARAQAAKSTGVVHVYSTLANNQKFAIYDVVTPDRIAEMGRLPTLLREVVVRGGAGVATKNLVTPLGVYTPLSQEDYDAIKDQHTFKLFIERGFITVDNKQVEVERAVANMTLKDPGAPITPSDYVNEKQDGSAAIPTEFDKVGSGWAFQFAQ
jgi:hypothetical protein